MGLPRTIQDFVRREIAAALANIGVVGNTIDAANLRGVQTIAPASHNHTGSGDGGALTNPQINDTSADHQYVVAVSELTADRTVTLPLLTGNDTFVFADHAQTLTNKTFDATSNVPSKIAETVLTSAAASIDFQNIPGTFRHLLLVVYGRGDQAGAFVDLRLRFNGDSATNYDHERVEITGTTVVGFETFGGTSGRLGNVPANTAGANLFGPVTVDIPHYANASNNKAAIAHSGYKTGTSTGNMGIEFSTNFWRSNSAITQVTIFGSAGNLVAGTVATLYGLPA